MFLLHSFSLSQHLERSQHADEWLGSKQKRGVKPVKKHSRGQDVHGKCYSKTPLPHRSASISPDIGRECVCRPAESRAKQLANSRPKHSCLLWHASYMNCVFLCARFVWRVYVHCVFVSMCMYIDMHRTCIVYLLSYSYMLSCLIHALCVYFYACLHRLEPRAQQPAV